MAAFAASHGNNGGKEFQKSYFDALGICCSSEVGLVESIVKSLDGVQEVSVIVPTKTVIVLHDSSLVSQLQIVKALNEARLKACVRVQGVKNYQKKWPSPYAVVSGVLLLLSFLKYVYEPFQWLALGAVAAGIIPIVLSVIMALRNLTFGNIHILVLIAVVGSIALKDYWEAGTIVFLFTIAEWLESRAIHKATAAMSSLVSLVPQRAILAGTGKEIDVSEIKEDTVLAVKDGEIIPVDGVVLEGICEVDEKALTGESFPVAKQKGSTVWAGTVNVNALAEHCMVAKMAMLVEEAQNKKSKIQRYIDKCAKYYTPAVVGISASLAIVPATLRVHNQKEWFHLALVVLVSACPCGLILSTPVAMFCALTKAAASGVFFKGADYLETLAKVKIMAFDKTGTITRAEFEVTEFRSLLDDISLSTLLYWVSSIESKSNHPLATALVDFAQSNSVEPKPDEVENYQNCPGEGIYGKIEGKEIYIGNQKISSRAGCSFGKSVGCIFLGSTPVGFFSLADVCRTGAKEALTELNSMGIKTVMLTGDCYAAAKLAQDQLGGALEVIHAELLPEEKARIIKDCQEIACTAMIGDGLNDAPALATADIGISMGISGSALATETGNVILMTNDIQRIPKVARLARRVHRKVIENIILSVTIKASILALAIAGHPLVWAAVLADTGTCLLVILNSMLLLGGTSTKSRKTCKNYVALLDNENSGPQTEESEFWHTSQPPCDIESQKNCDQQTCSSKNCISSQSGQVDSSSCRSSRKYSNFGDDKNNCCGNNAQVPKEKCSDRRSCNSGIEKMLESSSGCCAGPSNNPSDIKACLNQEKKPSSTDEVVNLVKSCCNFDAAKDIPYKCKNDGEECGLSDHSTGDVVEGNNHVGCKAATTCSALNKRQMGGCCERFRKQCCIKTVQFGDNIKGALSEIRIE
ncbi:hypothetical protein ACH5RR_034088 [Cinchona calisaya]|uniref:HMA domain-containing protein n=1 Tax=Cinchona calisaya TaxID=153742 RepID=A0ABD2YCW2_9GENT